jgi:hypothetical protein
LARKIVTRADAGKQRKYGGLRILRDGRLRFSANPGPNPTLEFWVGRVHGIEGKIWIYDSACYLVDVRRVGNTESLFLINVDRSRVESTCFNIQLGPGALRKAVADLRKAGNGIERWLAPGLELTQRLLRNGSGNPDSLKALPRLLESVRDPPRPKAVT